MMSDEMIMATAEEVKELSKPEVQLESSANALNVLVMLQILSGRSVLQRLL